MIFKAKPNCIPNAGRNLVIQRQFQCTYYITRLEIFWKEVCLILIVSITAVTMIHLLKCGWCLVTMNASFAHYMYRIVEVQAKFVQISYFFQCTILELQL